jgi:hypothetical protein
MGRRKDKSNDEWHEETRIRMTGFALKTHCIENRKPCADLGLTRFSFVIFRSTTLRFLVFLAQFWCPAEPQSRARQQADILVLYPLVHIAGRLRSMDRSPAQLPNIRLLTRAALFDARGSVLVVATGRAVSFAAASGRYCLSCRMGETRVAGLCTLPLRF